MRNAQDAKRATQKWLDDIVIKHNFCPFARFVRDNDSIRYVVEAKSPTEICQTFVSECRVLDSDDKTSTTLIILTGGEVRNFDVFLDVLDACNQLLVEFGYEGVYQIASFHPDYEFEGESKESPSNYTNRSPLAMLHLIRESDIEEALKHYKGSPEQIFMENKRNADALGSDYFKNVITEISADK